MSASSDPSASTPTPALEALETRVSGMAAAAKKRRWMLTIAGLLIAVVAVGYLSWAWFQIDRQLDAPTVVALAEQQASPFLEEPATAWAGYLEEQAPGLIDQAATAALAAPPQLTEQLLGHVDGVIDERMPELEKQFEQLVRDLVEQAAEAAGEEFRGGDFSDAEAAELVDQVTAQFETSLQERVDGLYDRYLAVSAGMIDELDRLAAGEGLSEKEELHRELVTSFFALVQRVQAKAPR